MYIKPPWLCCRLPTACNPVAPSKAQEPLGKGFPGSKVPTLYPEYPELGRSSLQPGLPHKAFHRCWGAIPMWECLSCFSWGPSSHSTVWQTLLPSTPIPAASNISQAHNSLFSTLNNQETLWHRCHHASVLVLGAPKNGSPLQVGQRLEDPALSNAGISYPHHVTGAGRNTSLPGSFPVCC